MVHPSYATTSLRLSKLDPFSQVLDILYAWATQQKNMSNKADYDRSRSFMPISPTLKH